jgi:hypothetical protein
VTPPSDSERPPSRSEGGLARRDMLRLAGAATSIAWVAPSVLSIDRVGAQGSPASPFFRAGLFGDGGFGATTLPITIPPGTFLAGDRLLALALVRWTTARNAGITAPAGWTTVEGPEVSNTTPGTSTALRGYVFTTTYDGVAASYTFTKGPPSQSGNPTTWGVLLVGFADVHPTTPFDGTDGQGGISTSVTAPAVTTTVANSLSVFLGGSFSDAAWTVPPLGYLAVAEGPSTVDNPEGFAANVVLGSPGPNGPLVATTAGATQDDYVAFQIALRPLP